MLHRRGRGGGASGRGDCRQDHTAGASGAHSFQVSEGMDSLLSIVQMPKGIPVATFAIGEAGAANAALFAVAMLALNDEQLAQKLSDYRKQQAAQIAATTLPDLD